MDPVVQWILRIGLAALIGTAALHKLAAPRAFVRTLRDYRLLPRVLTTPAACLIIALEVAVGPALVWPGSARVAAVVCGVLLTVYSGAIATNLVRGRRFIDCGCLGPSARQPLSGWLLVRNGALVLASAVAALPIASRPFAWVDGVSIGGGLCAVVLLFQAANLLAAQAARSNRLRRSP